MLCVCGISQAQSVGSQSRLVHKLENSVIIRILANLESPQAVERRKLSDGFTGNLDTRTSLEVMALFQELNDEGVTLLVVTHEEDIACYARRVIELRDGRVLRDELVRDRRRAAEDMRQFATMEVAGAV